MEEQEDRAIAFLADSRFHRSLILPPNPAVGRLSPRRFTYAHIGHGSDSDASGNPVLVFCMGMAGTRLLLAGFDKIAKVNHVRVLCVDKPGTGGSEMVPIEDKIQTWLDTLTFLLEYLGIKHVSLASHSAGAIYALNVLLYRRDLLAPQHPYVALLSPWVHPSHSGAIAMKAASMIPNAVLSKGPDLIFKVNKIIGPVINFSSGLPEMIRGPESREEKLDEEEKQEDAFKRALWRLAFEYAFAENTEGLGPEALFCLKRRGQGKLWGDWEDYDIFVRLLIEQERHRDSAAKLEVDVFHAESDMLLGKKGQDYFDDCWSPADNCVDYSRLLIPGTSHETIVDHKFGLMERILKRVGSAGKSYSVGVSGERFELRLSQA